MAKNLEAVAALVARHIVADASRSALGLISDAAVARRMAYYRDRVEARIPGAGNAILRAAMVAAQGYCEAAA